MVRVNPEGGGEETGVGGEPTATHLLRDHDGPGGQRGAANARDGKQLDEACHVIPLIVGQAGLLLQHGVDIKQVSGGLERSVPETAEGFDQRDGGDESGAKLQPPRNGADPVDGQVCGESEEDAKGGPHLPAHDKAAADDGGDVLCSEDRHGGGLAAHADAEQEASDEELLPALRAGAADDGQQAEHGRHEDGAPPAEIVV
ncbi:hypothetical protein GP486_008599 [Trichoglossum hirsutum]|uniref:Uncharacterized protein n=1 Tax=Trichoglossum hirsutum TaxID=265104 RepID=A0A9P8L4C8_9PEZI|nr:hypothetical protein GP486_008599 [Trichoglossum hirsutum]